MIRFSAGLVVVAIGVLVGGVVTSKLLLVYIAIMLSAAGLAALAIGVVLKRDEFFGEQSQAAARADAGPTVGQPAQAGEAAGTRMPAATAAATRGGAGAWPGPADWSSVEADASPRPAQPVLPPFPGDRQPPPPFGLPRTQAQAPAGDRAGTDVPARAWPAGPDATPPADRSPAGSDMPMRGRHAGPVRSDSFATPASPGSAGGTGSQATAGSPWTSATPATASSAPPAQSPAPAPPTRPGPAIAPVPVPPSPWSSTPSWFDPASRPRRDTEAEAPPQESAEAGTPATTGLPATDVAADGAFAATDSPETGDTSQAASEFETATSPGGTGTSWTSDTADEDDVWPSRRYWLTDEDEPDEPRATSQVVTGAAGSPGDPAPSGGDPAPEDSAAEDSAAEDASQEADTPQTVGDLPATGEPATAPSATADAADEDEETGQAAPAGPAQERAGAHPEPEPAEPTAADSAPAGAGDTEDEHDPAGPARQVTVVPGVPRYHDKGCVLIRFMDDEDLQTMTLDEASAAGCTPCRACQPDTGSG